MCPRPGMTFVDKVQVNKVHLRSIPYGYQENLNVAYRSGAEVAGRGRGVQTKVEPISDHMLVCLPEDAGANGYTVAAAVGDFYLLDPSCQSEYEGLKSLGSRSAPEESFRIPLHGQSYFLAQSVEISGETISFQLVYGSDVVPGRPPPSKFYTGSSVLLRGPKLVYNKDSSCIFSRLAAEEGTQCLGSACIRDAGDGPCRGLASCLDGLAAWSNRWELRNHIQERPQNWYIGMDRPEERLHFTHSSSGPRGGPSTATPDGQPVGYGGDGSCPELVPRDGNRLVPMARAVPRHVAPQQGENGMAAFYDCDLTWIVLWHRMSHLVFVSLV
eukprot:Skav231645  [mRNA]  locus=scaffold4482:17833:18816:- [translate_table: standard]